MLTPPTNFCNPNGVCAGTAATCPSVVVGMPPPAWTCTYPAATFEVTETRCDSLDNDCWSAVSDESGLGQAIDTT